MISNCGHDEKGKYTNGAAGDQTGTEWQLINWYKYSNGGWNFVARHPNKKVGEAIAADAKAAANNNNIGYDMNQRLTFWEELKNVNYNPAKIEKKCEADCSSGIMAIVKANGYKMNDQKMKDIPTSLYTETAEKCLRNAGFQILTNEKYLNSDAYLLPGDILVNKGHHMVTNLSTGSKIQNATPAPTVRTLKSGVKGDDVKDLQKNLNTVMGAKLEVDGSFGPLTLAAVKNFQKKYGLEVDGLFGPKSREAMAKALAEPKKETPAPSASNDYIVTAEHGLNVRRSPSVNGDWVKTLPYGTSVTVESINNGWAKLSNGNYVSANYIKKI